MLYISLFIYALLGFITSHMAKKLGKDPAKWYFLGILFGVFAMLWLYYVGKKEAMVKAEPKKSSLEPSNEDAEVEVPENSGEWYFLNEMHKPLGPFSFSEVKRKFSGGLIDRKSYVWHESWPDWKRVEDAPELLESP